MNNAIVLFFTFLLIPLTPMTANASALISQGLCQTRLVEPRGYHRLCRGSSGRIWSGGAGHPSLWREPRLGLSHGGHV